MILWERLDMPGHEVASITLHRNRWNLAGIALFVYDRQPCRIEYEVECDVSWSTRDVSIRGEVCGAPVFLVLSRDVERVWTANEVLQPAVQGCLDVDLGFSPSTNLLPIRRLNLAIGEQAAVRAAWVRFPDFSLEVLDQTYTRLADSKYLYESAGGEFRRELTVNSDGWVIDYPGLWRAETGAT